MDGPWQNYQSEQPEPQQPETVEDGPWKKYGSQVDIKLPDTSGIEKTVNDNISQHEQGANAAPLTPAQRLDAGMGMPVSTMFKGQKVPPALPAAIRRHINDSYAAGTSIDAVDYMQSALPASANASNPVTANASNEPGYLDVIQNAFLSGFRENLEAAKQTGQAISGQTPEVIQHQPDEMDKYTTEPYNLDKLAWPDFKKIVGKTVHGLTSGAPEIGAAIVGGAAGIAAVGGPEDPLAAISGPIGSGIAAAGANAVKSLAPIYAEELKSNNGDAEKAWAATKTKAAIGAAGTGVSFALFGYAPFENAVKDTLLQVFAVQTTSGATQQVVSNISTGQPLFKGTFSAAVESGAGTAVPMTGHLALKGMYSGHEVLKPIVGAALGKPADAVTENDISQAIRMAYEGTHATKQDYHDTSILMFGKEGVEKGTATLREINNVTGLHPSQVFEDAKNNPEVAKDVAKGVVPKVYDVLREPKKPEIKEPQMPEVSLWNLHPDELEAKHKEAVSSDKDKLIQALGEDGAKKFTRLERAQNSIDPVKADKASVEMDELTKNLTPDQDRLIYGIGEHGTTAEDLRTLIDAHRDSSFSKDDPLEIVLGELNKVKDVVLAAKVPTDGGTIGAQADFIRIKNVLNALKERGISSDQIPELVYQNYKRRGLEDIDAEFMAGQLVKSVESLKRGAEPQGKTPAEPSALPLPKPIEVLPPDHPQAPYVEPPETKAYTAKERPYKSPILKWLADKGGVLIGSDLESKLDDLGFGIGRKGTPVGLFKSTKEGGKVKGAATIDNIPVTEFNDQFDTHYAGDEHGNMHVQDVIDEIRREQDHALTPLERQENEEQQHIDLKNAVFNHAKELGAEKLTNEEIDEMARRYDESSDIGDAVTSVLERQNKGLEPEESSKLIQYLSDESGNLTINIPDAAKEFGNDIKRDVLNFATPMETGSDRAKASAKDFANAGRWAQWNGTRIFNLLKEKYTPEQLKTMWNALDESSDYAQKLEKSGMIREEAIAKTEKDKIGHFNLPEDQKQIIQAMSDWAKSSWERAKKLDVVEGEGIPFWTPRMAAVIGEDGTWTTPKGKEGKPSVGVGRNLTTTSGSLKERKYETAAETEEAMKNLEGGGVLVRDIRTMPLALTRLNQAIAGRALISEIKDMGHDTGADTVVDGAQEGYFTIDHPSFQTYKPRLEMGEDGKWSVVKDENGDPIFDKTPIYVSKEFEGPLKAVLSQDSGAAYKALMELKGKSMGLIMYSPVIHNAVEWGRALPAMPGKVVTFKIYFEGNKFKKDPVQMQQAINDGMVPIGSRFFNQDISSIMETPDLTPGRSWTAKLLGGLADTVSKDAGNKVKASIDSFGDFWHNTLLWDRVADLQAGLYKNIREQGIKDGLDPNVAGKVAAHMANRYAGALPMESMGDMARKIANVALFSRSFTIGNLGVMKDIMTGLPSDVKAQILRDVGEEGLKAGVKVGRRKATAAFAIDIALMYAGNSLLQDFLDKMERDKTLDQIERGYVDRFKKLMADHSSTPWDLLNIPADFQALSSTSSNEPGKENRIHFSDDPKTGTAYYMRAPQGKVGEEFIGWMTSPLEMLRKKLSPIASPLVDIYKNEDYFGHPVYDKEAAGLSGAAENLGKVVMHFMKAQVPADSIVTTYNALTGSSVKEIEYMKAAGPLAGLTLSKGYPGGPEAGILAATMKRHESEISDALPKVKKAIESDDEAGARKILDDLSLNAREQKYIINHYKNPAGKVNVRSMRKFERFATPEEKELMEQQSKE